MTPSPYHRNHLRARAVGTSATTAHTASDLQEIAWKQTAALYPRASAAETQRLITIAQNTAGAYTPAEAQAAAARLVESNLRLALYVASRYVPRFGPREANTDLNDLLSVAQEAMWRCIPHYRAGEGASFGTFAIQRMRAACTRTLRQSTAIRIPEYLRVALDTERRTGDFTPLQRRTIDLDGEMLAAARAVASATLTPLTTRLTPESDDSFAEVLVDSDPGVEEQAVASVGLRDILERARAALTPLEYRVFTALSLDLPEATEVATGRVNPRILSERLGYTREYVRVVHTQARRKLRLALADLAPDAAPEAKNTSETADTTETGDVDESVSA